METPNRISRPSWDQFFMMKAKLAATRSTCSSRPVGCVIARDNQELASGYNGALSKWTDCLSLSAPGSPWCARRRAGGTNVDKPAMCLSSHAEANAVAMAAKIGIALGGATCYCTLKPCETCQKLLAAAGIVQVYFEYDWDLSEKSTSYIKMYQMSITAKTLEEVLPLLTGVTSSRILPATE